MHQLLIVKILQTLFEKNCLKRNANERGNETSVLGPFGLVAARITDCSDVGNKERLTLRKRCESRLDSLRTSHRHDRDDPWTGRCILIQERCRVRLHTRSFRMFTRTMDTPYKRIIYIKRYFICNGAIISSFETSSRV